MARHHGVPHAEAPQGVLEPRGFSGEQQIPASRRLRNPEGADAPTPPGLAHGKTYLPLEKVDRVGEVRRVVVEVIEDRRCHGARPAAHVRGGIAVRGAAVVSSTSVPFGCRTALKAARSPPPAVRATL